MTTITTPVTVLADRVAFIAHSIGHDGSQAVYNALRPVRELRWSYARGGVRAVAWDALYMVSKPAGSIVFEVAAAADAAFERRVVRPIEKAIVREFVRACERAGRVRSRGLESIDVAF